MPTINQLINNSRKRNKKKFTICPALKGNPFKLGLCQKVYETSPKKPNSAVRKIAKVRILHTGRSILARIIGKGHNLKNFSTVLVRGGKANDIPGVHYTLVKGVYDFSSVEAVERKKRLSKYGCSKEDIL